MKTKLERVQAVKARVMRQRGCSANQAAEHMAKLVNRTLSTVHKWLSADQSRAIPDNELELLELKTKGSKR